jgi:nicotinate phosphoribosyltransferase
MTDTHIGLKTDKYELTMLEAFIKSGTQDKKAVFELFGRKLPETRSYGVVAGTQRAIDAIVNFTFSETDLEYLEEHLSAETIEYLRNYKFSGNVKGYREGDYWLPYAPLLTIEATLGEGVILETLLLSIFNYDTAVASAASHMYEASKGANLMEFGSRRVNEDAAVVAARSAYIGGFNATSNLEAGRRYGIPVYGTSAHAFTLAFPTELEAFKAQVAAFGTKTTMLVDTYDIEQGVINAIEAAGTELGAVRIDSGDPFVVIPAVRKQLDELGATKTKIVLSGDLDEETLQALTARKIPVDSYGVGTAVSTGGGYVASGLVYKLVSVEAADGNMVSVAKKSAGGKKSVGGEKTSYHLYNKFDEFIGQLHYTEDNKPQVEKNTTLVPAQFSFIEKGEVVFIETVDKARARHLHVLKNYPAVQNLVVLVNEDALWER